MKRSLWTCILFTALASAPALEVQQVIWGFDGQVVPGRFNLLSLLIANPSLVPFDGTLNLYKSRGLEQRVGAIYGAPCYISPGMTRWVQFYLFVDNQHDQWRLEWGRAPDDRYDVKPPKWGPPACVLLSDASTIAATASTFKQFPEELFPPTAAATSGLGSLLLDHAPRWETSRRQALLNWLRAGGKVHLLLGADGRYPIFSDELSAFNSPLEQVRIGAGLVVRHATTSSKIPREDVDEGETPMPQLQGGHQGAAFQAADSFLRALAMLSNARHSWGWIYALVVAYLGVVGPGIFWVGRRVADYRLRIVLLVVTVAAFAGLFNFVGRRGQGEASVVHALSYARAIDGSIYNVMQWINVFATRGAQYTITHSAQHNLYATGQDYEPVNGHIQNGKAGQFFMDIPRFSRRAFLHEAEMKGAEIPMNILNWDDTGSLKTLTLTAGPDFTRQILEVWAVQRDRFYAMNLKDGRLELAGSDGQPLSALVSSADLQQLGFGSAYSTPYENNVPDVEGQFRKLVKPLIAWSLRGTGDLAHPFVSSRRADGRVQLFIFARSPASFSVIGPQFGREIGFVLYHLDLFKPGS